MEIASLFKCGRLQYPSRPSTGNELKGSNEKLQDDMYSKENVSNNKTELDFSCLQLFLK